MAKATDSPPDEPRRAQNGPVSLGYRVADDPDGSPLLLLGGNAAQMLHWPAIVHDGLRERGFRVAMLDHRDSGYSTHCAELPPYDLRNMADDALAVLEALGWASAHLVGVSLGAMIAQVIAANHPERVRTLTSISSAPGWGLRISRPRLRTVVRAAWLTRRLPADRDDAAQLAVALFRLLGAPGQHLDETWLRATAAQAFDIDPDLAAGRRQIRAAAASGDRRSELGKVRAPTLVVHGDQDPAQSPAAARATVAAISGAQLLLVTDAGHVLPDSAWPPILDAIHALTRSTADSGPEPNGAV